MWKAIVNFFKAIDRGLINVEDYFDYRVKTGKWVGDVKDISQDTHKGSFFFLHRFQRSRPVRIFVLFSIHVWHQLLRYPAVEKSSNLVTDAFFIIKSVFIESI